MGNVTSINPINYGNNKAGKHISLEISKCPFCGGDGNLEQDMDETWSVSCINKNCYVLPITQPFRVGVYAVRAWNQRF